MNVSGTTSTGASAEAMKKAMAMPNLLLNLLGQTSGTTQSLNTQSTEVQQAADLASVTGKGKIIDVVG
nr:hypothetical protein [uncultured Desulfobacter sp.]